MTKFIISLFVTTLLAAVLVNAQITLRTGLEKSNFTKLTSYSEMITYLEKLTESNNNINMKIIGKSVQGRDIPALFFSINDEFGSERDNKPIVLVYCQQHGNEPSGKEAALIVSRKLLNEHKNLLLKIDLIIVPQVNPDGGEIGRRRNANDMDLNRNHVILSEPESNAIHSLFLKWMPEVTLDIHEFNAITKKWISHGFTKDAEEMLGSVTNLNIDESIKIFSKSKFIPEAGKKIVNAGFRFHEYIVGSPFKHDRIRYSTTSINDGRQSMGIYNTLSFIIEGKRYGDLITNIKRRTEGQEAALISFLETASENSDEILNIVRSAREKSIPSLPKNNRMVDIRMDYFPDQENPTLNFPIFNLYTWQHEVRELENFAPIVKARQSIRLPIAYAFSEKENKLIELLDKHQIKYERLDTPKKIIVQKYRIKNVTDFMEEDKPAQLIDVESFAESVELPVGTVIIKTNQIASNLIPLILEPQSSWSIVTKTGGRKYRFKNYIEKGKIYPIWRIEEPEIL